MSDTEIIELLRNYNDIGLLTENINFLRAVVLGLSNDTRYQTRINAFFDLLDDDAYKRFTRYKDNPAREQAYYADILKENYSHEVAVFAVSALSDILNITPFVPQSNDTKINYITPAIQPVSQAIFENFNDRELRREQQREERRKAIENRQKEIEERQKAVEERQKLTEERRKTIAEREISIGELLAEKAMQEKQKSKQKK